MAGIVAKKVKKQKTPAVLKHYGEVPEVLPDGDFKPKCKYCGKEITGSTGVTTNWWKEVWLFSIAGKVFTPERCWLTDKRF